MNEEEIEAAIRWKTLEEMFEKDRTTKILVEQISNYIYLIHANKRYIGETLEQCVDQYRWQAKT